MIVTRKLTGCANTAREMEAALALLQLHDQGFIAQEIPLPKNTQFDLDIEDTTTAALYLMRLFEPIKTITVKSAVNAQITSSNLRVNAISKPVTAVSKPIAVVSKPKSKEIVSYKVPKHRALKSRNVNTINTDMVPIGCGYAKVPSRLLKSIRWTPDTYTSATRKLLTAVFSRSVLATHSLTGKPSPAFPNKPAKQKLNEQYINDIVHTVVAKCGVAPNLVRTSITTKCADESKMHRTRQNKKTKRKNRENRVPVTSSESDEKEV